MNYIDSPYLPKKRASLFIADTHIENAVVIRPPQIFCMQSSMQHHADLGISIISKKMAVCAKETYTYYKGALSEFGFEIIEGNSSLKGNYPHDCAYNVGIAGKKCFMNTKICDSTLFNALKNNGYDIIHVNQGYAKCSMCAVDENSLITSDVSIYRAATQRKMDALLVSNDNIKLDGFENGFFGGASGFDGENIIINGNAKRLSDYEAIKKFLSERGIGIISLKDGDITDIGSIIPLMTT